MTDHEHDWRHATGDDTVRNYDCAVPGCLETLTVPRRRGERAMRAPLPPPIRGEDGDDWGALLTRVTRGLSVDAPRRRAQAIEAAAEAVRSAPLLRPGENRHAELAVYAELETMRDSADYLMGLIVDYLAARGAPMGERFR